MPPLEDNDEGRYRVVTANLDVEEIAEADRIATMLREAGWPGATRSLVIREALARLRERLADKTDEEIFQFFVDHRPR